MVGAETAHEKLSHQVFIIFSQHETFSLA
jgi:hypothetical protein